MEKKSLITKLQNPSDVHAREKILDMLIYVKREINFGNDNPKFYKKTLRYCLYEPRGKMFFSMIAAIASRLKMEDFLTEIKDHYEKTTKSALEESMIVFWRGIHFPEYSVEC